MRGERNEKRKRIYASDEKGVRERKEKREREGRVRDQMRKKGGVRRQVREGGDKEREEG